MWRGLDWRGIEKEESILSSSKELSFHWLAHVIDEKSIPPFKIDIFWAIGESIPDYVPTWFLLGYYLVPSPHGLS
jgi:hypothetical protein